MENKDNILKKLCSTDPDSRKEAVEIIKTEGDQSLIPALLDLLSTGQDHRVTTELVSLLADIKDNHFKKILIDRIVTTSDPLPKSLLLRICWESALDFSDSAEMFARMILTDDFIVALEAATILENMSQPSPETREAIAHILQNAHTGEEKQFLIDNVLHAFNQA